MAVTTPTSSVRQSRSARRGFFLTDMMVGLILVGILTVVLGATVWRTNLVGKRLADNRAALRLAERTLADLRTGTPHAAPVGQVQLRRLSDGPAGQAWVEVRANVEGRSTRLVGMVDAG